MTSKINFVLLLTAVLSAFVSSGRVKRVIGGTEVTSRPEVGWMVRMNGEISTGFFSSHNAGCGGTIIADRWILSAAHCFRLGIDGDDEPDNWHVRSASLHRKRTFSEFFLHIFGKITNDQDLIQMEYHPESIIIHPEYDANSHWKNDIALIKIKETFNFQATDRVKNTKLSANSTGFYGKTCTAYGWGCTRHGGTAESHLQKVALKVTTRRSCGLQYVTDMSKRICAGGERNGKAMCSGDSGGPLMCTTSSGKQVQSGIMSYMVTSNVYQYPGVFTDIASYRNWIERTTGIWDLFE